MHLYKIGSGKDSLIIRNQILSFNIAVSSD
jgi:hypothetical protein